MNEEVKSEVFHGACPHDCPDTCAMDYEVRGGKLISVKGQERPPDDPWRPVREAEGLPRSSRKSGPADVSAETLGPEGLAAVRAHHLGRSDLRDRPPLARDHRDLRRAGDHAAKLPRQHGPRAGHQLWRPVLQPPRLDGEREDLLHVGLVDGMASDAWAHGRRRPGKLRALQVHRHLGLQFDLDQPASLAIRARGAEARRQGRRRRFVQIPYGKGRRLAHLPQARHRRRTRVGHHQFDGRARSGRPGLRRQAHPGLARAQGAGCRIYARLRREGHRR